MKKILLLALFGLLGACANPSIHYHYIQQGNYLEKEKIAQLKHGMSRQEVADLLGTPVLDHPFDLSRWDYIYLLDETGVRPQRSLLSIEFRDNRVVSFQQS